MRTIVAVENQFQIAATRKNMVKLGKIIGETLGFKL
jgi:hypothetical protein